MIDEICFSEKYILTIQKKFKAKDKMLIERVVYALYLLQELSKTDLKFIFKGGTSLLLLLEEPRRFSIDIDIQVVDELELLPLLENIVATSLFLKVKEQSRNTQGNMLKRHYHFTYLSQLDHKEYPILLDIVFGLTPYEKIIEKELKTDYLLQIDQATIVKIPDRSNLLADKLTAFAPTTIGIKLGVGKSMEIMKQFYDISILSENIDDFGIVRRVYVKFIDIQNKYRETSYTLEDVTNDSINALLAILSQGKHDDFGYFKELNTGIMSVKNHIFYEPFSLVFATAHAAKLLYLYVVIILGNKNQIEPTANIGNQIRNVKFNHLKFLRKTDPNTYCLVYEALEKLNLVGIEN